MWPLKAIEATAEAASSLSLFPRNVQAGAKMMSKWKKNTENQSKSLHFKSLSVFYGPEILSECMGSLTSLLHAIRLSLL